MNILVVMIPLSIVLLVGAAIAFFWAVEHGQFDDLDSPRILPLLDDPAPPAADLRSGPTGAAHVDAPAAAAGVARGEAPAVHAREDRVAAAPAVRRVDADPPAAPRRDVGVRSAPQRAAGARVASRDGAADAPAEARGSAGGGQRR